MSARSTPSDEHQRVTLLRELGLLDSPPEDSFDTLVRCVAKVTGCPIALLSLLDAQRLWFKASHGLTVREIPREGGFCSQTCEQDGLFEVPDAAQDERFAHSPCVAHEPHIRFYAGMSLKVDGLRLGALCVMDTRPRQLDDESRHLLTQLAHIASDMLESRRHLQQLRHERERMGDFARASGDWMWEVDSDFRCTWLSESFEALTHIPVDQVIGMVMADSPLLDTRGEVIPGMTFMQLLQQQRSFIRVTTLRETPHGPLQISRSAVPRFDAQGRFAGYRGTARDVSESIRIHKQLAAQDVLLRKLSSQVPGVIFQFQRHADGRTSYPYASDAARELFGVEPPKDGNGGDPTVPFRMLHPDDRQGFMASISDSAQTLKPWMREYRVILDNGEMRWMETRAAPEPLPDGGILWHGFTADISARKQTELALRESQDRVEMASEAAGIGIMQLELQSGLLLMDRRTCINHGLRYPQDQLTVQGWMNTLHPADQTPVTQSLQKALDSGQPLELRYRVRWPDGRSPTLELLARGVYRDDGCPTGLVGTCRDVSATLVSERLQREKEAAERANRAKSEFLSRVSHELRTPLNGILGFAQLMSMDKVQPLVGDQQRRLDSVLRAGRHLLDLINEVLDLSRIESEDFRLQLQSVNLSHTVQACLNLVQPLADGLGVRLPQTTLPTEHHVLADPRALEQVLMNLLSNAIKYNRPHGAVTLSIEAHEDRLALALSDEGLGLSAEQQAALFQPFNRLGAERSRIEGSGLGLVISRDLMHAMGGVLSVHSQLGHGATFTIELPRSLPHHPSIDAQDMRVHHPTVAAQASQRAVLYVEDEPLNIVLMQEIFRQRPEWTLDVANDGANGLSMAREKRPDLILVDMNLPDMTGITLLHHVRQNPETQALRCIALSADALPEQIAQAKEAGFDDYWTKPIDIPLVLERLKQCLG